MDEKCEKCGKELIFAKLTIIDGYCWKCNAIMKIAVVQGGVDRNLGGTIGPDEFTPAEINTALENGAIFKEQYSKTGDETYLANTCKNCNSFIGNFFLHKDYLFPATMGEYLYKTLDGELYCESCTEVELRSSIS